MDFRIIPRDEWGARYLPVWGPAPQPAEELYLHHSATIAPDLVPPFTDDNAAIRTLERIGQQRFGGGISYTFAITPVGRIYEGHPLGLLGSHTYQRNGIARGIVFVGNFDRTRPTEAMLDAAAWLIRHGHARGWWTCRTLTGGHRDVRSTDCPGDAAYALIPEINRRALGGPVPTPEEPDDMAADPQILQALDRLGDRVEAAVDSLYRNGFSAQSADGKLDPTHEAVSVRGVNVELDKITAEIRRTNELLAARVSPVPPTGG